MNNFEEQLDKIRIGLYEKTKNMNKEDIIQNVNSNAKKIANEFGIKITHDTETSIRTPVGQREAASAC